MNKERLKPEHFALLKQFGLERFDENDVTALYFAKDEYIQRQGYECPYVMLVYQGKLKVLITAPDGKTLLYCYSDAGDILGEVEFATQCETAASTIQTMTDVCCIGILRSRCQNELFQSLSFMTAVSKALAQKLCHANEHNTRTIINKLETRLCAYISMTQKNGCFNEKLTEISEVLSTSYRHLLRTLEKLCREGVLEKVHSGYFIKNEMLLKQKSEPYQ